MIESFRGEHKWLSNFEICDVMFEGKIYPSSEHAYQAAKTTNEEERDIISKAPTPGAAKELGNKITLRSEWTPENRIKIMREILWDKFTRNRYLGLQLIATTGEDLIEGNNYNDKFWGKCPNGNGEGENNLGKILMEIRTNLIELWRI